VEMILRLVDQATGPIRAVESELEKLDKIAARVETHRGAAGAGGWAEQSAAVRKTTETIERHAQAVTRAGDAQAAAAQPIRAVESELDRLGRTAATAARADAGPVKASVWIEQQQAIRKAREEAERYEQTVARVNAAQAAAVSAAAARGVERVSTAMWRAGVREGVAGEHSQVSLETQGNSPAQVVEIQRAAAELSRRHRTFSQTQIENMLGDAQTFVGSLDHATTLMPDLLRLRAIQQGQHGHSDDKEFGSLVKALEQGGVASDPERARRRIDTFARWMEVYRDTFRVNDINEFYRGLKGPIARSLDEDFLRGAGGHFIQEMGGHSVGNALTQMAMAIQAGRAQPRALAALDEIGLLDENKIIRGGPFGIKAAEPGAIKDGALFGRRPDLWVWNVLGPALDKLAPDKREEIEAALFSDQTARNIADKLLHQRPVIEKDYGFVMRAPGLPAAETWASKDPAMAATATRSQFDNLMRDAAKPFLPGVVKFMNWLSDIESRLGKVAEEHPAASAAAGVGAIFAGWTAAAAIARRALIYGGQAWGEGLARATGDVAKEPGIIRQSFGSVSRLIGTPSDFTNEFVRSAGGPERVLEVARGVGATIRNGLITGALQWAGQWALGKFEEKAFGWTPEIIAGKEAEIARRSHEWWRSIGVDMPWWEKAEPASAAFARMRNQHAYALPPDFQRPIVEGAPARQLEPLDHGKKGRKLPFFARQPEPPPMELEPIGPRLVVPTFAMAERVAPDRQAAASEAATPHVDTSEIDAAKQKAKAAGEEIKQSLDVTASPTVDAGSLDSFLAKLREARSLLGQLDQLGAHLRRQSFQHPLHDGPEAH
ncbi:hypothetical protein, partial [Methylosinus sp. Sm6]|uniref:hypothetical protein n=1 Tax=Methylosinus sp. Sm6 TaxID=2866948 RepID=UPI001C98FBF4